jgi:anti-sigma factor RsiW
VEATVDCHEVAGLLGAYHDGELEPALGASVRDHVAMCAACRQRLMDLESLGRVVRRVPYYTASDQLRATLATSRARAPWRPNLLAWAAVLTMVASLGGSAMFVRRSISAARAANVADTVAEDIVGSHVRATMGDHLFDVRSTDQHTVKPWFTGKLDFSPPVQDLVAMGFPLVGGRLDYVAGRPAAALVYQRRQHVIDLFVWPESATSQRPDARSMRGFQLRRWTQKGMSFWAVSDLNDEELDQFVHALQE